MGIVIGGRVAFADARGPSSLNLGDLGERQTGLIAQELQEVLPEAVHVGTDEEKTLSIAYGNMMGLMVEAIKELTAKVEKQDKIIYDLLQKIQDDKN